MNLYRLHGLFFENLLYEWVLFAIFVTITHAIVFNLNPFVKVLAHFIKWYLTLPFSTMIGIPILIIIVIKECEVFKYQSNKKNLTSKS